MTPGARVSAAIDCLDKILAGAPSEQVLTRWARDSRFAGSKDSAAVRDHVFEALRAKRSFAALGGALSGRGIMIGALRAHNVDPTTIFGAGGHAPSPLTAKESASGRAPSAGAEAADMPDWLWPMFTEDHGADAVCRARALSERAPVFLRVNGAKTDLVTAQAALTEDGSKTKPHSAAPFALEGVDGARKLRTSSAYQNGLVELQDAASQAVVAALPLSSDMRILDYCAGGGGKTLALAGSTPGLSLVASDVSEKRLRALIPRAERAGVSIKTLAQSLLTAQAPFDIVLCDAPCSGSGSWRRDPDGKWALRAERLAELNEIQLSILESAARLVAEEGLLAYATCSVLEIENTSVIERFQARNPDWVCQFSRNWDVLDGIDGFFTAHLTRRHSGFYTTLTRNVL